MPAAMAKEAATPPRPSLARAAPRVKAVLVSSLYALFASGVAKLRAAGLQFASGAAVCSHVRAQHAASLSPQLSAWPTSGREASGRCALLAVASLALEVGLPPLVLLFPRLRSLVLLSAVGLHLGIALTMQPCLPAEPCVHRLP